MRLFSLLLLLLSMPVPALAQSVSPEGHRQDALSIEALVNANYAYLERLPGGVYVLPDRLRTEAGAVHDQPSLLHFAEHVISTLADPHAITGGSFRDSWALVPSYTDLWIERDGADWRITSVREASPAESAGVRPGDRLVSIGGEPVDQAVAGFWADLGVEPTSAQTAYAVQVLAAGRRDRARSLGVRTGQAAVRDLVLPNLYAASADRQEIEVRQADGALVIRFNDSLGDDGTVAAFDAAMAATLPGQPVVIDLTDTASGGNTTVARAVMGWFVDRPTAYQVHNLPSEERETGIPRQWIEQVLPRPGKHHAGPVTVRVGRWTGSMGEGLAIGFDAIGARVVGDPMAGLLGAVYDYRLENSGLVIKLPTERLFTVDGLPREAFRPEPE